MSKIKASSKTAPTIEQGVDELIARLREDGINQGKASAEAIVTEAQQKAQRILSEARAEAQQLKASSKAETEAYRRAIEDSLHKAIRDAVLSMKASLMDDFSRDVQRLITHEMKAPEFLQTLVLQIAAEIGRASGIKPEQAVTIELPIKPLNSTPNEANSDVQQNRELNEFVQGLAGHMLSQGVSFRHSDGKHEGIVLHVDGKNVHVDVTDKAIAELLLQHLQPRFRALMEGILI